MPLADREMRAIIAVNRFGLGARDNEMAEAAGDPQTWLESQLDVTPVLDGLLTGDAIMAEFLRRAKVQSNAKKQKMAGGVPMTDEIRLATQFSQENYQAEVAARIRAAVETSAPLPERLVWFWSNHFSVSRSAVYTVGPIAGAFEREAIRPHVFGSFADMLLASTRHPAMLLYLDNASSVGPGSPAGQRSPRGLNENLGREVLELHTLGVAGGYTQRDVTTFAEALTGWTVDRGRHGVPGDGAFRFDPDIHEPGDKKLLGKTYLDDGEGQVRAVLSDIAKHPATARHVATKLARHFIADDPPDSAIDRLAGVFLDTGGDLRAVTHALIRMDEPWRDVAPKVKSPTDLVVSAFRGLDMTPPDGNLLISTLTRLGQSPFAAPAPTGWPDTADTWASPYSLARRIEWGTRLGAQAGQDVAQPETLARSMLGEGASELLIESMRRAKSRPQAVSLLLASPEFQRR